MNIKKVILTLFILLNLLDFALSSALFTNGVAIEGNPLLSGPLWRLALVKFSAVTLIIIVLYRRRPDIIRKVNIGLVLVVLWNLSLYLVFI